MNQTFLIFLALANAVICLFFFGIYSVKSVIWKTTHQEASFFGAGIFYSSPAQTTTKYQMSIYPAPWAISIIWPVVVFWNIAALTYLLYRNLSGNRLFHIPHSTLFMWTGAWLLTTVWTFLFDGENHLGAFVVVAVVLVFSCCSLVSVCRLFHGRNIQLAKEANPKEALSHPFRYLAVEALAIITTWSVCALAISIGYALAYKNSLLLDEPILTGILTPEESATAGAIFILVCYVSWWILDTAYWGEMSNVIRTIYPAVTLILLSLGLSNYSTSDGMTFNNMLCFGISALSTFGFITRQSLKALFRDNCTWSVPANESHED